MTGWRNTLASKWEFIRFVGTGISLFKDADDPKAFAEALANEDFDQALDHSGMSEAELLERADEIEREGNRMLQDDEVAKAVEECAEEHQK